MIQCITIKPEYFAFGFQLGLKYYFVVVCACSAITFMSAL